MIAVDLLIPVCRGVPEAVGLLLGDKQCDLVAQADLVALEGEQAAGLLVADLDRDGTLTAHGVDEDFGAVDGQYVEQERDRHDLVGVLGDLDLAENPSPMGSKAGDYVDRRSADLLWALRGRILPSNSISSAGARVTQLPRR